MPSTPTYRTYVLPCPANAGKVKALTQWVIQWRELAELEKAYQLRRFRLTGGQLGLERAARFANAAAGLSCTGIGGRGRIASLDELLALA